MRPLLRDICSARITRRESDRDLRSHAPFAREQTGCCLRLSFVKTQFFVMRDSNPRLPRGRTGRSPSRPIYKARLVGLMFSRHIQFFAVRAFRSRVPALKYFPVIPSQAKAHCSSYIVTITIVAVSAFASIEYHAGSAFSWKKSCELSLFRKCSQLFPVIPPPSARSAGPAVPGSGRSGSPARLPSAPDRRRGSGSGSPSHPPAGI